MPSSPCRWSSTTVLFLFFEYLVLCGTYTKVYHICLKKEGDKESTLWWSERCTVYVRELMAASDSTCGTKTASACRFEYKSADFVAHTACKLRMVNVKYRVVWFVFAILLLTCGRSFIGFVFLWNFELIIPRGVNCFFINGASPMVPLACVQPKHHRRRRRFSNISLIKESEIPHKWLITLIYFFSRSYRVLKDVFILPNTFSASNRIIHCQLNAVTNRAIHVERMLEFAVFFSTPKMDHQTDTRDTEKS